MASTIEPPQLLQSTEPLLYETGYQEWPYAYAGSCFPVRWQCKLYIVSAFHCFENHQVNPESLLYPLPTSEDRFFGYCQTLRACVSGAQDLKHYDQIVLQVSTDIHSAEECNSVNAADLSDSDMIISLSNQDILDVWLRGFLLENPSHAIDYDIAKIRKQAYLTNGFVSSRRGVFDFCHMLKVKTPVPAGITPRGMSGSAVYAMDQKGNARLAGTVIEYNSFTDEFLVIDSIVLRKLLEADA